MTCEITDKLNDIEARFYGWVRLSDQQNEDIIWLLATLRSLGYKNTDNKFGEAENGTDVRSDK